MRYFFFDTETSGLTKVSVSPMRDQPRIIELFALITEDEKEVDHWHSLFNPGFRITDEIRKITGIKNDDLVGQPLFREKAASLDKSLLSCNAIVGHNLTFDLNMLHIEEWAGEFKLHIPSTKICTIEQTEYLEGKRLKLSDLHTYLFGVGFKGAHRAENDVRAMAKCFFELKKRELI